MADKRVMPAHEDLEERQYISTNVEFDSEGATFSGLPGLDIKFKPKQSPNRIEQIEDGRRKYTSELF